MRERIMSAPSKIESIRDVRTRLPQASLALTAMVPLIALLALGPVVPKAALWHLTSLSPTTDQTWVGNLANPLMAEHSGMTRALTSASYTSGFDKTVVGLRPEPVAAKSAQARDAGGCPKDLNCSFRIAKTSPPPQQQAGPVTAAPIAAAAPAPPDANAFTALTSRLPSPPTLLKPFELVSDMFTGFIGKL
jgi:hypothetical protein